MRNALVGAAVLVATGFAPTDSQDESKNEFDIEMTRTALQEWVDTQRIRAEELEAWRQDQVTLSERILLIRDKIESARETSMAIQEEIRSTDESLTTANAEHSQLVEALATLEPQIVALESRVRRLIPTLPEPLLDTLDLLVKRIPEDSANTKASMTERFQNVVGILNAANKFNREIQPVTELRRLENGSMAEVRTLYIGLSIAYYATRSGDSGGVGYPTDNGWTWTALDSSAIDIARAIEIFEGAEQATVVGLPLTVGEVAR
tara:strand:- start:12987 stop:13775 length:789 start_codon:yes stop_codon:yes gene_type:complete